MLLTPNAGAAGSASLQSFAGDATKVPLTVQVRVPGTFKVLETQTVYVKPSGTFSFPSALVGTYDVTMKASHWLRKALHNVVFPGTGYVSGLTFSLINGDVTGDNTINLADAVAISKAWMTKKGDAKYNPNADLNGDGTINLADAVIVSQNWRKSGDP